MKSREYFEKRSLQLEDKVNKTALQTNRELKKLFKKSEKEIQAKIDALYRKYATNLKIDMQTATMMLDGQSFTDWRMSLEDYVEKLKKTGNKKLYAEIETLTKRARISRLDAIQSEVRAELNLLYSDNLTLFDKTLDNTYKTSYYLNSYNIQTGAGIYFQIGTVDKEKMQKVLSYKNYGKNYSSRIWDNKDKLAMEVQQEIAQGFATSKDLRAVSKSISKRYGVAYNNSTRLILTENNFYMNQANLDSYKECEVDKYQYLATLDKRTSAICSSLDGSIFERTKAMAGTNFPPMHPRCRSTTIAYLGSNYVDRIARDKKGKNIIVGSDMTYKQWEKKYNIEKPASKKVGKKQEGVLLTF